MIVGIDEVGRGAWAGPLCVGAAILDGETIDGLTDSKLLSKSRRTTIEIIIKKRAAATGLGWVSARDLDHIGMTAALRLAASRALGSIDVSRVTQIIVDGTIQLVDDPRAVTMKKADLLVPSVSAASVVAKVARDRYMASLDSIVPGYAFAAHAGYGTAAHQAALGRLGPSPLHRMSFAPLAALSTALSPTVLTSGHRAEDAAEAFLLRQGYRIIERNWKTKWCEIDIIVEKKGIIHFVEVKHRLSGRQGSGLDYITPKKLRQMTFAARLWLVDRPEQGQLAAISLTGPDYEVDAWLPLVD